MHHPADRITHTMALLHQVWSTGWNEKLMGTDKTRYAMFVGLLVFSWGLFCLGVFRGRWGDF